MQPNSRKYTILLVVEIVILMDVLYVYKLGLFWYYLSRPPDPSLAPLELLFELSAIAVGIVFLSMVGMLVAATRSGSSTDHFGPRRKRVISRLLLGSAVGAVLLWASLAFGVGVC